MAEKQKAHNLYLVGVPTIAIVCVGDIRSHSLERNCRNVSFCESNNNNLE